VVVGRGFTAWLWGVVVRRSTAAHGGGGMKTSELELVLEALADPTRRAVLRVLVAKGVATATSASKALPVSRQAVVKHIGILARAELVHSYRQGREVRYAVRPDRLEAAAAALGVMAAEWEMRLAVIRRIDERMSITGPFGQPRDR
jgi:DNA-binding transcriptional ArsR family regulator